MPRTASSSEMTARANLRFWSAVRIQEGCAAGGVGAAEGQVFAGEAAKGDGDVVGAGVHDSGEVLDYGGGEADFRVRGRGNAQIECEVRHGGLRCFPHRA